MANGDTLRDQDIFEDLVFAVSPEIFDLGPGGLRSTSQERLQDRIKALSQEELGVLGMASDEIEALQKRFEELAPRVGEQRRRKLQSRGFGAGPFAQAKTEEAIGDLRVDLEKEKQDVLTGAETEIRGRRKEARAEQREEDRRLLERAQFGIQLGAEAARRREAA